MSDRRLVVQRRARTILSSVRSFFDTGNLLRFLLSMVLAFGLWAWVTYENDPETTRVLGGITVSLENLEDELEVVGDPPTVDITIQGPQSIVTPLERESVIALVDMSEVNQAGEYEVDVEVEAPADVRVRDVAPESVVVEVDQMSAREEIPLSVQEPDDVPTDYQVSAIDVDPDTVNATGPEQTVEQIERAEVQVRVAGRTSSFSDSIRPALLDEAGNELSGVEVKPDEILVTVILES